MAARRIESAAAPIEPDASSTNTTDSGALASSTSASTRVPSSSWIVALLMLPGSIAAPVASLTVK
jgi:hypothetical protein